MATEGNDRKIDYIEFNVADIAAAKAFYGAAFGWTFTDYGPEYCEFADGRLTALFGSSGSGKTSLLRCVSGLDRLPGQLIVGGEVWQDRRGKFREPHDRPVGYVFQEASLFPHLSVRRNLLYGHRRALKAGA